MRQHLHDHYVKYLTLVGLLVLVIISVSVGSFSIGLVDIGPTDSESSHGLDLLNISRIPRTISLILCGAALSVCGLIMQMLTQNHFVEPATAGSMQSAALGMLIMTLLWPAAPIIVKLGCVSLFSLMGTFGFLLILNKITMRATLVVPLIGIMYGAVISAITTFLAIHFNMLQSLSAWSTGDFSGILRGRYEILWIIGLVTLLAFKAADALTLIGMGKNLAENLGLNYKRTLLFGLIMVAIISGIVVATVGILPFLGLIVPNIVRLKAGDHVRSNLPWIALLGAILVLICDLIGRLIIYPFELPIGAVLGVLGAVLFLFILIRGPSRETLR